ncbi:MAG: hypothetical protein ACREQ5_00505 [Candidatus Dormibacteria bacterium]
MSDIAALAREAYAHGWVMSNGPMTERVKAGCVTAVALACEHAGDPSILEATLQLGSLEGTWAAIYERREKLYTTHIAAVTKAYRALCTDLDVADEIRRLRRALNLNESTTQNQQDHDDLVAAAAAAATRIAHQTLNDPHTPQYKTTIAAISDALINAEAEGTAGAIAIAAEQIGKTGINFDLAFQDAHDAIRDLDAYRSDAQGWLTKIVDGTTTDLSRTLAKVAGKDGSYDDMVTATDNILDGDHRAVDSSVDLAMGLSFTRGALAWFGQQGVTTVDFLTAGAGVCPICLKAEAGNPWPINSAPQPSLHPSCRCSLQPSTSQQGFSFDVNHYLIGVQSDVV